jgi:hypothetical protein
VLAGSSIYRFLYRETLNLRIISEQSQLVMVLTGAVALFPPAIDMISPVAASAETHNDIG